MERPTKKTTTPFSKRKTRQSSIVGAGAFLRDELRIKNAMLLRVTESIGELSARVSETTGGPRKVTPRGTTRVVAPASDGRQGREKPERPKLPEGYRVVAVASDAWVLVAPGGSRVAGYRGELDLWRARSTLGGITDAE